MNFSRLVFPLLFFAFFDTVAQSDKGVVVYTIGNTQQISAIAIDNQNTKWIGTTDQGLFSMPEPYNPITHNIEQFTIYNSSLPSNRINGLSLEGNRLAIATDAGVALLENQQWTIYTPANSGLVSANVLSILLKNGILYAGTTAGLCVLSNGQWTSYTRQSNGIPSDTVHDIVLTASDELWLATEAGLARIKPGLKVYTPENSLLQAPKVVGINADKWGKLWVKTQHAFGFSIQILTNNTFFTPHQLYPDLDSRIEVGPRLVNDARGNMWCVGETYESTAITRFNQYSSRSFIANIGINTGKTLAVDKDNRLWFAKHFGQVAAFWELDRFADPLPTSQTLTTKNIQTRISSCEDLFATTVVR